MDNNYKGMTIAIIILAGIHVILSLVFSVMAYRKKLHKEGSAWLLSFGVCVAILVLAAVATSANTRIATHTPLEITEIIARNLEREGITYWLDAGTLLGSWREGKIMEHDNDVDIAYLKPQQGQILEILRRVLPSNFTVNTHGSYNENIIVKGPFKGKDMSSGLDLYGYQDKGNFLQIQDYSKPMPKSWVFPLKVGKLSGIEFSTPANTKDYLELNYGNLAENAHYDPKTHLYVGGNVIPKRDKEKRDSNYAAGIPKKFVTLLQEIAPKWWKKCVVRNDSNYHWDSKRC